MDSQKNQPYLKSYQPKQALVVYSSANKIDTNAYGYGKDAKEVYYIEICDIMDDDGKAYISPGKPITKATMKQLLSAVAESDKQTFSNVTNLASSNILFIDQRPGKNILIWYRPVSLQTMLRQNKGTIKANVPALLYAVSDDQIRVFAIKGNRRPTFNTRLFHAPFFNVYDDAKVCMGNVKKPSAIVDMEELMLAWEKAFWQSEFTETVTGAYDEKDLNSWWRIHKRKKLDPKKLKDHSQFITLKKLCQSL